MLSSFKYEYEKVGIGSLFGQERQGENALADIIRLAMKLFGANSGGIMFYDERAKKLVFQNPALLTPEKTIPPRLVSEYILDVNEFGNATRVFNTGRAYYSNKACGDPNIIQKYVEMYNVKQLMTVPLQIGAKKVGIWHIWNKKNGDWEEVDIKNFSEIALHVSASLDQQRLFWQLQRDYKTQCNLLQAIVDENSLDDALYVLGSQTRCTIFLYNQFFQCFAQYVSDLSGPLNVRAWERYLKKNKGAFWEISTRAKEGPYRLDVPSHEGIFCPVWLVPLGNKQRDLGYMVFFHDNPYFIFNPVFLSEWATIMTIYLLQEQRVRETREEVVSNFLERLVEGAISAEQAVSWAAFLGLDLNQGWLFILALPDGCMAGENRFLLLEIVHNIRENLQNGLRGHSDQCWLGMLPEGLVILLRANRLSTSEDRGIAAEAVRELFARYSEKVSFSVGIGTVCHHPGDYPQAYRRALRAIEVGRILHGSGQVFECEKLGLYALLHEFREDPAAKLFIEKVLGPVLRYDQKNNADLLKTLSVYLETGNNLRRTAKGTYLHINTVRYRLARIEELTGRNLRNAQDCFEFKLALAILKVSKVNVL